MMNRMIARRLARLPVLGVALAVAVVAAACDTKVLNPGPVTDTFLDNVEAHQALANGAKVMLADALAFVSYTTGAVTREMFPAGSTSAFGISARQQAGRLEFDDEHIAPPWTSLQRARKIAEEALVRFEDKVPNLATYRPAAEATLWAGYANRMLAEAFCSAVLDGGAEQPRAVFLERAEQWFTKAIELGTSANLPNVAMAARAGRASVRLNRGNFAGAAQDAVQVPDAFAFNMEYTSTQASQYNRIFWAGANRPYRAHTVWNTFYLDYFDETGDPRTPHMKSNTTGDAALGILGGQRAPWHPQQKHNREDAPIRLSSGWEMRLTEAEVLLVDGNWQGALPLINKRRVALDLEPWTATSLEEAWTVYKRERGIELWLEGRRIADLRRWKDGNRPGALHAFETAGGAESYLRADQTLCYPIPRSEYETNPNLNPPG
jgi:starch-binding outer membrane protein, SusD/RagB family